MIWQIIIIGLVEFNIGQKIMADVKSRSLLELIIACLTVRLFDIDIQLYFGILILVVFGEKYVGRPLYQCGFGPNCPSLA